MRQKAWGFLLLALLAFAGLGLELLLAFFIEPLIYGKSLNDFNTAESIAHWLITCFVWLLAAFALHTVSKRKHDFDVLSYKQRPTALGWLFALAALAISITVSIIDWNGLKVVKEFAYNGWQKFIFQYMYYLCEVVLMVLIIAFGQKAGELWTKQQKLPWGGLLLGITWGLVHMLTQASVSSGLLSLLAAVLYGIIYIAARKNMAVAYPLILLAFVL